MVDVYYYVPYEAAENAVDCGLKLSQWGEKTVVIDNEVKRCFTALLSPKDDLDKFSDNLLVCLKLEVAGHYCWVADKYLYTAGLHNSEILDIYERTMKPIEQYIFGEFRMPEILITSTIIGTNISVLNKSRDLPVIFEKSEKLYLNNIIQNEYEKDEDIYNDLLFHYLCALSQKGAAKKLEAGSSGIVVFQTEKPKQTYILKEMRKDK
jgi:hypothetical protein